MNDDRKFQERAEIVKQLLLARIPTDIVAKVAGISDATVTNDRIRVAKLYGIKVPNASSTSLEREERFRMLLKTYLTVKFETREWENPIYQAARLLIDFDRIDSHIGYLERFYEGLQRPQFSSDDPTAKGYQQLIEDCLDGEHCYFSREFYEAVHSGSIPCKDVRNEDDLIELATKFCLDKNRSSINTLVIDNPKAIVNSLLPTLTEVHITALKEKYGLGCPKRTPDESGKEHGLSRERVRQIREKALGIFRDELKEKKYLIHSSAKYERLEKQYAELDEKYRSYCKETDLQIVKLNAEIYRLKGLPDELDGFFDSSMYSNTTIFLIKPIEKILSELPVRIINCLKAADFDYVLDMVENWEDMRHFRNFGKKSYTILNDYLTSHGINRSKITKEEKILARQLIKRKAEVRP